MAKSRAKFKSLPNDLSVAVIVITERADGVFHGTSNGNGNAVTIADELLKLWGNILSGAMVDAIAKHEADTAATEQTK